MDFELWMRKALKSLDENVQSGTVFECKALFEGHEWDSLSRGDRINFGKYFSSKVKDGVLPNVIPLERAKNNHARYMKTGEE